MSSLKVMLINPHQEYLEKGERERQRQRNGERERNRERQREKERDWTKLSIQNTSRLALEVCILNYD